MEIVLPAEMTVAESHDIALALQHKVRRACALHTHSGVPSHACCTQIEELEEVERAFVHVDYQQRDAPEHKVERELLLADSASSTAPSLQQRLRSRFSAEAQEEGTAASFGAPVQQERDL